MGLPHPSRTLSRTYLCLRNTSIRRFGESLTGMMDGEKSRENKNERFSCIIEQISTGYLILYMVICICFNATLSVHLPPLLPTLLCPQICSPCLLALWQPRGVGWSGMEWEVGGRFKRRGHMYIPMADSHWYRNQHNMIKQVSSNEKQINVF